MNDRILGYCGLYCGGCGIYQASARGEKVELEPGVHTSCTGCNSDQTSPWCTECAIKTCARQKGFRYCLECGQFPCDTMTGFIHDEAYPYHMEVEDQMKRLQAVGREAWEMEMERKYTCPTCQEKFNWFEKGCSRCISG